MEKYIWSPRSQQLPESQTPKVGPAVWHELQMYYLSLLMKYKEIDFKQMKALIQHNI